MGVNRSALTNGSNELHFDAHVLQSLPILRSDGNSSLHRFAIHIQWRFLSAILVQLNIDHLASRSIIEDDIDIDWSAEEVRHLGDYQWYDPPER